MPTVHFTSSETFMGDPGEPNAYEHAEVEVSEYIEGTYDNLRTGPHGDEIAFFIEGAWQLPDGRRFSDWAVKV